MNTAKEIAAYFASLPEDQEFMWQAFNREHIEEACGEMSEATWQAALDIYDDNPATLEDFGIPEILDIAERG